MARGFTGQEDVGQVPGVGGTRWGHTILGERNHGAIIEDGQQHDQQCWEVPAPQSLSSLSVPLESPPNSARQPHMLPPTFWEGLGFDLAFAACKQGASNHTTLTA